MEQVREARLDDLPCIAVLLSGAATTVAEHRGGVELLAETGVATPLDVDVLVARLGAIGSRGGVVLVGTWDDVAVGTAVVVPTEWPATEERVAHIRALWVDPEARGLGVGEALLDAALAWAVDHECVALQSDALPGDRATKNAFERFGMVTRRLVVFRRLPSGGAEPHDPDRKGFA